MAARSATLNAAVSSRATEPLSERIAASGRFRQILRHGSERSSDSVLIQGDNLDAMKALSLELKGQVRCIYIDPPYHNNESYNHYRDRDPHDQWLSAIKERLLIMRDLLTTDGSIWISIDDREVHYLRMLAEEIFGRENFITTIIWQHRRSRENRKAFSNNHEYILCLAKSASVFRKARNLLPVSSEVLQRYKNPDNDPRGPWQSVSANVQAGHATASQFYKFRTPAGSLLEPPKGRCWAFSQERMIEEVRQNNVYFGRSGTGVPRLKKFLNVATLGMAPETLWVADDVGTTENAKRHVLKIHAGHEVFDTPKPEALIHRILEIASDAGDLILDAYLGSGTTAAVALKMKRHVVGIEQGDHAITHCSNRLKQVVAGESGGISSAVAWTGGRGFAFFRHQ